MGGSYKLCTECGKHALSIATRCPGCGREFQTLIFPVGRPDPGLGRFLSPGVVAGVLASVAVLATARLGGTSQSWEHESSFLAEYSVPADSVAASSEVAYALGATALPDSASAALPAESAGELRVAGTWIHVRKSRSKSANLEAVLTPGDTVLADSLERGWYRVALEGEVLGYVHRSTLTPGTATEQPEVGEGRRNVGAP